jgi:hypothetical protein
MMCEIRCRVVNTLVIYSDVHGYEYIIFAHRPPIMTRTSLITFRHFRQIKEENPYLKLGHCCVILHFSLIHCVTDIIPVAIGSQLLATLLSKDGMT